MSDGRPDWNAIEQAYRFTEASIRSIAAAHRITEAAIRKHAKKHGWARPGAPAIASDAPFKTKAEAELHKEIFLAKLREQEFEQKAGKLVDADEAKRATFNLARVTRDAWQNWPSRVAPVMAADLGVDAVKLATVLDRYVRQHLAELSERVEPLDEGASPGDGGVAGGASA